MPLRPPGGRGINLGFRRRRRLPFFERLSNGKKTDIVIHPYMEFAIDKIKQENFKNEVFSVGNMKKRYKTLRFIKQ